MTKIQDKDSAPPQQQEKQTAESLKGFVRQNIGGESDLLDKHLESEREGKCGKDRELGANRDPAPVVAQSAREIFELLRRMQTGHSTEAAQVESAKKTALLSTDTDEVIGALKFLKTCDPAAALDIALSRVQDFKLPRDEGFEPYRVCLFILKELDGTPDQSITVTAINDLRRKGNPALSQACDFLEGVLKAQNARGN
jgi:hypothetical protein